MLPLDLHVLGLSLAFILSQDQTLRCIILFFFFYSIEDFFYLSPSCKRAARDSPVLTLTFYSSRTTLSIISSRFYSLPSPGLSSRSIGKAGAKIEAFLFPSKYFCYFFSSFFCTFFLLPYSQCLRRKNFFCPSRLFFPPPSLFSSFFPSLPLFTGCEKWVAKEGVRSALRAGLGLLYGALGSLAGMFPLLPSLPSGHLLQGVYSFGSGMAKLRLFSALSKFILLFRNTALQHIPAPPPYSPNAKIRREKRIWHSIRPQKFE